jgi:ferredoxin, 2Fe-2S
MPSVTFMLPRGVARRVEAPAGSSLLEAARQHGIPIEGACGGAMACATCHIHVVDAWFARLEPAGAEEEDMLELAQSLTATSRLGCQLRLRADLDGLVVVVPRTSLLEAA